MKKLREIERLRGVAIVLAVFNHPPLHDFTPGFSGVVGVHLFFVISGFVIARSLLKLLPARGPSPQSPQSSPMTALKTFFVRRFFRIVPLALFSTALVLAASAFFNSSKVWSPPAMVLQEIGLIFTLLYNYQMLNFGPDLLFFWSLNVEEHFYLALPLLFLAVRTPRARRWAAAAVVGLTALVLRPWTAPKASDALLVWKYHFSTLPRIDTLMAGVLVALIVDARLVARPRATFALKFGGKGAALAALATLLLVHRFFTVDEQTGWTLVLAASVVLVALASLRRGLVLGTPVVAQVFEYLGSRSYAIYLLHLPVWKLYLELQSRHPNLATYSSPFELAAYFILASLGAAELGHRWIELPMIRVGKKLATGLQPAPALQASPLREAA